MGVGVRGGEGRVGLGWLLWAVAVVCSAACDDMFIPSAYYDDGAPPNVGSPGGPAVSVGQPLDAGPQRRPSDAGADVSGPTSFVAPFALGNMTAAPLVVRGRALRPGLKIDCQAMAKAPQVSLSVPAFGPSETWVIPPGRAVPIRAKALAGAGDCRVVLLESSALGSRIVFWSDAAVSPLSLSTTAEQVPPARLLRVHAVGGEPAFAWHAALYPAPVSLHPAPPPCALPAAASAVAWSEPAPVGPQTILALDAAPDGCLAVVLKGAQGVTKWYVCLPAGAFPFAVGGGFTATALGAADAGGASLSGLELAGPAGGSTLRLGVGAVAVPGAAAKVSTLPGCLGEHDACGGHALPLALEVMGSGGVGQKLLSGEEIELDGGGRLYLVAAREMRVLDPACVPAGQAFMRRVETVLVSAPGPKP